MKIKLPALAAILLAAVSCLHSGSWETLCDVETYVYEHPDSALQVMRGIDTLSLCGRQVRAKYSLFYTAALDKNGIDTADLRLIRPAVRYYRFHGTAEERARSLYYQGRIYGNGGEYNNAIVSFTEALPLLEDIPDKKFHGQLYSAMSIVYQNTYDVEEALVYAQKEYDMYKEAGSARDYCLALYNYAIACSNMGYADRADSLYRVLIDVSTLPEDMRSAVHGSYAELMARVYEDYVRALPHFNAALSEGGQLGSYGEWGAYACALCNIGETEQAKSILDAVKENDPYEFYFWRYKIDGLSGDYRSAYENLRMAESTGIRLSMISSSIR